MNQNLDLGHQISSHALTHLSASTGAAPTTALAGSGLRAPLLVLAALATGLQAGLYFAFAVGVMPGLSHADDRTFITAMQTTNVSIQNPVFFLSFFGAPLLGIAAIFLSGSGRRGWVIAAAVLAVATFMITVAGNVPLNDALAQAGPVDQITDLAAVRHHFEGSWVGLNIVRTLTSTAALGCLVWAALGRSAS